MNVQASLRICMQQSWVFSLSGPYGVFYIIKVNLQNFQCNCHQTYVIYLYTFAV